MTESRRPAGAFAPFEWMIAARYLRAKRKERFVSVISVISLIGVALGVATLIIVMSVMGGFRVELLNSILGINGHITVQARGGPLADYDAMAARIRAVPGVVKVTPFVEGQALASQSGYNGAAGVNVRGLRVDDLLSLPEIKKGLTRGAIASLNSDSVIIGNGLANRLDLARGSMMVLTAPQGDVTPFGPTPRSKGYIAAGTFKVGNSLYDSGFVFMTLGEAQDYFNTGDGVTGLEVMLTDPEADMAMFPAIARAAGPNVRLARWQDLQGAFFQAVQVESSVMFLILSLIVLVAALNIISGLVMLVKDKSPDIAILRTMGASRGAIMRVFLIAGMSIGLTGTLLGFAVGLLFCHYIESIKQGLSHLTGIPLFDPSIYFLEKIPAVVDPGEVAVVVAMALGFSFLATLYPSWRAARLDPVEALRYE